MQRNNTEPKFKVSYVKPSQYATICTACKGSIPENDLRLAVMVETPMTELTGYKSPEWHHFTCFFTIYRPKSTADFSCFHLICFDDQKKIKEQIDGLTAAASATSTTNEYDFVNKSAYPTNTPSSKTSTINGSPMDNTLSSSVSAYPNNLPVPSVSSSTVPNIYSSASNTPSSQTSTINGSLMNNTLSSSVSAYPNNLPVPSVSSSTVPNINSSASNTPSSKTAPINRPPVNSSFLSNVSAYPNNLSAPSVSNSAVPNIYSSAYSNYSSTATAYPSSIQTVWNAHSATNVVLSRAPYLSRLLQLRESQITATMPSSQQTVHQNGARYSLGSSAASTSAVPPVATTSTPAVPPVSAALSTAVSSFWKPIFRPILQPSQSTAYPTPKSYVSTSSKSSPTIRTAPVVSTRGRKRSRRDVPASVTPSFPYQALETSFFTYQLNNLTASMVGLQVKDGVAVDPQSRHAGAASVYRDLNGNVYNAVLLRTDWESEKNSYHKLQILERRYPKWEYWLFQSKGEIGSDGYMHNEQLITIENAVPKFEQIFFELTGNLWANRKAFQRIPGKKIMLDVVYKPNVIVDEIKAPSQLVGPVQKFIRLIHRFGKTDREMESHGIQTLNLQTWPLGMVSGQQILEAYGVLQTLEDFVGKPAGERTDEDLKKIIRCTNLYYSLIPHNFGTAKPPLLSTLPAVQEETEMLDSFTKIEVQYSLIDAYYKKLNAKLRPLGAEEVLFEVVKTCLLNTNDNRPFEIVEIFDVERVGEDERYTPYKRLVNRKMLWHGSKVINFSKILAQGLCIAPEGAVHTGHVFGRGIYFSDMVAKSVNYCDANASNDYIGLLLLCEVALGNMQCLTGRTYMSSQTQLAAGFHSVKAVGCKYPDPQMNMTLEDGVEIALGHAVVSPGGNRTSVAYNEYIVYNEAQVKIRYLAQVAFKS